MSTRATTAPTRCRDETLLPSVAATAARSGTAAARPRQSGGAADGAGRRTRRASDARATRRSSCSKRAAAVTIAWHEAHTRAPRSSSACVARLRRPSGAVARCAARSDAHRDAGAGTMCVCVWVEVCRAARSPRSAASSTGGCSSPAAHGRRRASSPARDGGVGEQRLQRVAARGGGRTSAYDALQASCARRRAAYRGRGGPTARRTAAPAPTPRSRTGPDTHLLASLGPAPARISGSSSSSLLRLKMSSGPRSSSSRTFARLPATRGQYGLRLSFGIPRQSASLAHRRRPRRGGTSAPSRRRAHAHRRSTSPSRSTAASARAMVPAEEPRRAAYALGGDHRRRGDGGHARECDYSRRTTTSSSSRHGDVEVAVERLAACARWKVALWRVAAFGRHRWAVLVAHLPWPHYTGGRASTSLAGSTTRSPDAHQDSASFSRDQEWWCAAPPAPPSVRCATACATRRRRRRPLRLQLERRGVARARDRGAAPLDRAVALAELRANLTAVSGGGGGERDLRARSNSGARALAAPGVDAAIPACSSARSARARARRRISGVAASRPRRSAAWRSAAPTSRPCAPRAP